MKKARTRGKKGSLIDIAWKSVFMFAFALMALIGWMLMSKVNTNIQANPGFTTEAKQIMQDATDRHVASQEGLFLFVHVAIFIFVLLLAFNIQTHQVYFIGAILFFIINVISTAALGNAFYDVASSTAVAPYADDYTVIPFYMNHIVEIMLVEALAVSIVIYAKNQGGTPF